MGAVIVGFLLTTEYVRAAVPAVQTIELSLVTEVLLGGTVLGALGFAYCYRRRFTSTASSVPCRFRQA